MSVVHVGCPPNGWEGAWGAPANESHRILFHNFERLPAVRGNKVTSPTFNSLGSEWTVDLYPNGRTAVGNIEDGVSLYLRKCSGTEISVHFEIAIKSVGDDIDACRASRTFKQGEFCLGWPDFASRAMIMDSNVLQHGSLVVEVRIKEHTLHFIPKNPFMQNMLQSLSDLETSDVSFKVEFQSLLGKSDASSTDLSEVFNAHKLVLKICVKGSILASLCENCDGSEPVPIKDVHPRVFRLLLRYIYGGDITSAEWKDQGKDLIEAADKYGLTSLKIEAESWYVKLFKPSVNNVVEALAYADRMNCFLLRESAAEFIAANLGEVLSSGTLKNIPETKDIMNDILVSVAKIMTEKGQTRNFDNDDFNQLSIDDLRAKLASKGKDVDGSRATLIGRLKQTNSVDA
jgi:hypothetical protein